MPSKLSPSPFLSLRPDHDCGRTKSTASTPAQPFSPLTNGRSHVNDAAFTRGGRDHSNGYTGGLSKAVANGLTNGTTHEKHQGFFIHLEAPQQDFLLLLHGPRQKYSLERAAAIPELREDHERLVQVLAIGLNPVDWKGADYGFSQPSYPWVNARDFAGIVAQVPRKPSRMQQGDVVYGPSTDYREPIRSTS